MTPEHPKWNIFIQMMEGKKGCNFRIKRNGNYSWICLGDKNKPIAKKILKIIGNIDIEGSMKYFDENGGYCDCEILFNLA